MGRERQWLARYFNWSMLLMNVGTFFFPQRQHSYDLVNRVHHFSPALISSVLYVLTMEHDHSDILGYTGLPVSPGGIRALWLSQSVSGVFIGVVLFVVYIAAKRLWKRALVWQEESYLL